MQRVRELLTQITNTLRSAHDGACILPLRDTAQQALAILDEIEAAQPKWTQEPPTEEGLYLCACPDGTHLVSVEGDPDDGFYCDLGPGSDQYEVTDLQGVLWLGPLPEPPTRGESPQ